MKYLIVMCNELGDQWECDANRTPMFITDDWRKNAPTDYKFEVYEILDNGEINQTPIKDYDEPMESGMAFGYYRIDDEEDNFHLIQKFKNRTRDAKIPNNVLNKLKNMSDFSDFVESCGYACAEGKNRIYVYGEYFDNNFPTCW